MMMTMTVVVQMVTMLLHSRGEMLRIWANAKVRMTVMKVVKEDVVDSVRRCGDSLCLSRWCRRGWTSQMTGTMI